MRRLAPLLLAFLLSACHLPAVQDSVQSAINAIGRSDDGGLLLVTQDSVAFDPGLSVAPAESVTLFIGGEGLQVDDPRCEPIVDGYGCKLGTVRELVEIPVTGSRLSANVNYIRGSQFVFFYAREVNPD